VFWGLLILTFPFPLLAQNSLRESLRRVEDMLYICDNLVWEPGAETMTVNHNGPGCGDVAFWEAVKGKLENVPPLIRLLRDTTPTAASVPNFGGPYTIADVAWSALQEIIHDLPTWGPIGIGLLGVAFDRHNCGYCAYWNHLRSDHKNRIAFSKAVKRWFKKHRKNLVWIKSQRFETCDGCRNHPNGGHFEMMEEK
jgi:hypothetical protein